MTAPVIAWGFGETTGQPPTTWDPQASGSMDTALFQGSAIGMMGSPFVGVASPSLDNGDGTYTMVYEVTAIVNDSEPVVGVSVIQSSDPHLSLRPPDGLWGDVHVGGLVTFPPNPNFYGNPGTPWDDEYPPTVYYIVAIDPVTNERSANRAVMALTGGGASWGGDLYQSVSWFIESEAPPSPYFWTRLKRTVELAARP